MIATILVAVEDPFRLELIQGACESEGYHVILAADLEAALTILARRHASLVIVDQACYPLVAILEEETELSTLPIVSVGKLGAGVRAVIRDPLRVDDVQRVVKLAIRRIGDRRRAARTSKQLRVIGDVTGAGNVHHLRMALPYELIQAERTGRPLGCVVLQASAEVIDVHFPQCMELIRTSDLAFRSAPTEIVLLLPEANDEGVRIAIKRLGAVCPEFRFGMHIVSGKDCAADIVARARNRMLIDAARGSRVEDELVDPT